jgi:hypothetical protein
MPFFIRYFLTDVGEKNINNIVAECMLNVLDGRLNVNCTISENNSLKDSLMQNDILYGYI